MTPMRTPSATLALSVSTAITLALTPLQSTAQTRPDSALAHARALLRSTPLIDGHNDLPWEMRGKGDVDLRQRGERDTDLPHLADGLLGGQFWSVYIPGELKAGDYARVQLEQIDIARRLIATYPDRLQLAVTADDVGRAFAAGKVASLLGMEGGQGI